MDYKVIENLSRFEDYVKTIGDGNYQNLLERKFIGIEVGPNGIMTPISLSYFANYSLTMGKEHDGSDVGGIPEHIGNLGLDSTGFKYCSFHPYVRYVGRRNRPADYQEDVDPENHALVNLKAMLRDMPGPC